MILNRIISRSQNFTKGDDLTCRGVEVGDQDNVDLGVSKNVQDIVIIPQPLYLLGRLHAILIMGGGQATQNFIGMAWVLPTDRAIFSASRSSPPQEYANAIFRRHVPDEETDEKTPPKKDERGSTDRTHHHQSREMGGRK